MKYILTFLMLFGVAYAQEPTYTPMKGNYKFKGLRVDSLFLIPSFSDTTAANATKLDSIAGAMIRTGNDFWMRNAGLNAWLQNVNIGAGSSPIMDFVNQVFKKTGTDSVFYIVAPTDTFFAFKISGKIDSLKRSSDSIYFKKDGSWYYSYKESRGVDTIYRTLGKDSIFFKIAGTTYKIKDSICTDSPDRIDGLATGEVTADMDGRSIRFSDPDIFAVENAGNINLSSIDSIKLSSYDILVDGNFTIRTPSSGNVARYNETSNGINGNFSLTTTDNSINLNAQYNIRFPGVYVVTNYTSTNAINLPDVGNYAGQMFTIFNATGSTIDASDITATAGNIYDRGSSSGLSPFTADKVLVCYSDGSDYRCFMY